MLRKFNVRVEGTLFHEKISKKFFALSSKFIHKNKNTEAKVLFYFFKNVHIPILIPIFEKFIALYPNIKVAFAYKSYEPEMRAGLSINELKILKGYGVNVFIVPQHYQPTVTFVADSVYDWVDNCGKIVNVGHGILSKGLYYSDTELARREERADLVFVPGEYHKSVMSNIISTPTLAVGMAKLDAIFNGSLTRLNIEKSLQVTTKNAQYVLFAPTFNDELSSIPFVLTRIVEILEDKKNQYLIIKLHGTTKQEYKDMYQELCSRHSRLIYADSLDITPLLVLADVMITDVSSAMVEFAALDKPVVLFNNPNRFQYKNYNEEDIEYKFRGLGEEVNNLDEMIIAARSALNEDKDKRSSLRQQYTDKLLANKYSADACDNIVHKTVKYFL